MIRTLTALFGMLILSSCTIFNNNPQDNHIGICKELKQRMIFNGATFNQTKATQQRAEMGKLTQSYNNQGC